MKKFQDLTFSDHYMFEKVLQNKDICKQLLERLLKIKIEKLEFPELEKEISPYYETRGVRLDVYIKDSDQVFDIELQNYSDLNLPLRTRYYQSMLDIDNLIKGQHYSELPASFIIFICTFDPFKQDMPIYTFVSKCLESSSLILEDKATKKFFNAKAYNKEEDVEIKAFLEYICKQEPVDAFTKEIHSLVHKIKLQEQNKKEYETMNIHDQDTFYRGKKEGIQQGIQEKAIETARKLLNENIPTEQVVKWVDLPLETVEEIAKNLLPKESL